MIAAKASAEKRFSSDKANNILRELEEDFDIEEEEYYDHEFEEEEEELVPWRSERGSKVLVNVDSFGAVGDGVSDDTKVYIHTFFHFLLIEPFCYVKY